MPIQQAPIPHQSTDHCRRRFARLCFAILIGTGFAVRAASGPGPLPPQARQVLNEDWSSGRLAPDKWYLLQKRWGQGNHGVVKANVRITSDRVKGNEQNVLVCDAHGDQYRGRIAGFGGKTRVGGVVVTKAFFASGRFEVVMKIGATRVHPGGPADPKRPCGAVPAVWTYGYRYVHVEPKRMADFTADNALYNPLMRVYDSGANEYWSEIDFPEFGKAGDFDHALYNTFLQNRHDSRTFDVSFAVDGQYHTLTTEWRTELRALPGVRDEQVIAQDGFWWIQDPSIPFDQYDGNPLRRLGKDQYAVCQGKIARHWIDGKAIGENTTYVPAMAAQLNLGVWLPEWGGPAPWETASVSFASVKVWQYDDPGDVRGILTEDIPEMDMPSQAAGPPEKAGPSIVP